MKKSSLIAVATVLLALSGCADHSAFGPQTEQDEKEYNSFDFSTINNNEGKTDVPVAVYDAQGQRLSSMQRGLNIVKYASGKTVKVAKK